MKLPLLLLLLAGSAEAAPKQRVLTAEVLVPAPVEDVWAAWTTNDGIATFFAPKGMVDLRVDGTYDIWFNPDGKPTSTRRGARSSCPGWSNASRAVLSIGRSPRT